MQFENKKLGLNYNLSTTNTKKQLVVGKQIQHVFRKEELINLNVGISILFNYFYSFYYKSMK